MPAKSIRVQTITKTGPLNKEENHEPILAMRIRAAMDSNHILIKDLAEKTGITRQSIGYYVEGSIVPDANKLAKIAKALNLSSDYLLGLTDEENNTAPITYGNAISFIRKLSAIKGSVFHLKEVQADNKTEPFHLALEIHEKTLIDYYRKIDEMEKAFDRLPAALRITTAQEKTFAINKLYDEIKDKKPTLYSDEMSF